MDRKSFIRSLYDAFGRGDAETVLDALASDVEWREAETQPLAEGNPYVGPEAVAEGVFGRLLATFDGFAVTPEKLVAEGETVVAMGRYTGTHKENGESIDAQFAHVWTVRDGEVRRFQQYADTAQLSRVMGPAA